MDRQPGIDSDNANIKIINYFNFLSYFIDVI